MKRVVINIGLNSVLGGENTTTLYKTIKEVSLGFSQPIDDIKLSENGGGDWGKERVAVIKMKIQDMGQQYIFDVLDYLCIKLSQDAIAYKINGIGGLRFKEGYEGERFKFKEEYFQNF